MFFYKLHPNSKVGYKRLSDADLGLAKKSHQTHIGLHESSLGYINNFERNYISPFIYENTSKELLCLLKIINRASGKVEAPLIRKGETKELNYNGVEVNSITREVREIVERDGKNYDWYLMWFGLENEDLVFYLFNNRSKDYEKLTSIIGNLRQHGVVENADPQFQKIIDFLERKINKSNLNYFEELEIIAQTDEIPLKIIQPKFFDIEKAKKLWKETGRKGEELVAEYLETLKSKKKITNYNWLNKSRESSFPYDFEITNLTKKLVYTDVKTTSYKFDQKMIFSNQEIKFINQPLDYHVYRVYDLDEKVASLRVCENINLLSKKLAGNISTFETGLVSHDTKLNALKLAISPTNRTLTFNKQIALR